MKTSELTGAALNWAVAKCEGATDEWRDDGPFWWDGVPCIRSGGHDVNYRPSSEWWLGGPIIEREGIGLDQYADYPQWQAFTPAPEQQSGQAVCNGPTPLIAAMRCYVASKLGDEIDLPKELT
jgi:hypothetical protein